MTNKFYPIIDRIKGDRFLYPFGMILILTFALSKYYFNGSLILGGEGNNVLNFTEHLNSTSYQWFSVYGQGMTNLAPSGTGVNILLLALLENISKNPFLTNFMLVFCLYYLPFLGMYLAAREIKLVPLSAFLVALFYLINPSTLQYLANLNQWNASVVALMPFLFLVILRFYKDNLKLFLFSGATTAIFSVAYTNQPLGVIANLASLISLYIISFYFNKKMIYSEFLKKYLIILSAFILFNFWWLLNLFYTTIDALFFYSQEDNQAWLTQTVNAVAAPLLKCLTLTILTYDYGVDFIGSLHNSFPGHIVKFIPITLVVLVCFFSKEIQHKKIINHIFLLVLVTIFLTKGPNPPFGEFYLFLFKYFPLFNMFKSPIEKFGLLYIFLFTLLLLFIFLYIKNSKESRIFHFFIGGYLMFCFIPIATGNIIPDHSLSLNSSDHGKTSRKYTDKPEYIDFRTTIIQEKLNYKIMSFPGMGNYQVLIKTGKKNNYTGWDPLLKNINKGFLQPVFGRHITEFYSLLEDDSAQKMLGMLNIGKLLVNPDLIPWFGFVGSENSFLIRKRFENMPEEKFGNLSVFNNFYNFLPIVYSPRNIFIVQ
jgi:hypothetical protein